MELTEGNKAVRLSFAKTIKSMDVNRCVFLGGYELNGTTLWCVISNLRASNLLIDYSGVNSGYYAGFLEEEILPIWNSIGKLTIVHVSYFKSSY